MSNLAFEPTLDGLHVQWSGHQPCPVEDWTLHKQGPGVGALMRLRDDGEAVEHDNGRALLVSWRGVAGLTTKELRYIGLPDAMPFALEVVSDGSINDADFQIHYGYIGKGRRILGVNRRGAWLWVGEKDFVLLDPLYAITEAIDEFNRTGRTDIESRMLRWGQIAELLPDDTVVDNRHLRSLKIVVASTFALNPFVNEEGEPDFDPIVGRRETRTTDVGEDEKVFAPVLPTAPQEQFARKFRGLSRVRHRYAVGGSAYVVLTPEVERSLRAVRRAQGGTANERRDFLRNVSGYLRGALDTDEDAEVELDRVFSDDGLSERVRGIGIWEDRALPWIKRASEPWLPPEQLGLRFGSQIVVISADDLPSLRERTQAAMERGDATVEVDEGTSIPANSTTLEAIDELIRKSPPVQRPKLDVEPREKVDSDDTDQVLLVIDNLEAIGFERQRRRRKRGIANVAPVLRTSLMPHQEEALSWLCTHWAAGSWGALLADDMGLGKTLTALAFLSCLQTYARAKKLEPQPMLVVAPTGLLRNWQDEHDKHLSGRGLGRAVEAHGAALRRMRRRAPVGRGGELALGQPLLRLEILKDADWVLTTYETLRDYQHSFGRIRWRASILDEAQKIKNPNIRLTEAALAMDIDFALLMTGTPVENRPADIWSLLDRAEPGRFGTLKDFSALYERETGVASSLPDLHRALTQPSEESGPALMLRRLKEERIPRLPQELVHRRVVEMPSGQANRYANIVLDPQQRRSMLQSLHYLRSISLHPRAPGDGDIDDYIAESARLSETFKILDSIAAQGEKALLFVESRQMQDFLIGALRRRFELREDVLVINGAVSGRARKARVDKFQNRKAFDVMILSPRAGGVGLTLTAANHVIHLSRWWNPAVEDQCTDRAFRIGQERTVHVYLPLAKHPRFGEFSFDLKLDSLMERKREMNRQVLAPAAATPADVSDLYKSTMTEASADGDDRPEGQPAVDLLEPTAFESWVLQQLASAGYETRQTPRSGDRGADGLAYSRMPGASHTIVVQCKHMQPEAKCGVGAVREVLASLSKYDVIGEPRPMVVSNAAGFTAPAQDLARAGGVWLVDRNSLSRLRTWHQ